MKCMSYRQSGIRQKEQQQVILGENENSMSDSQHRQLQMGIIYTKGIKQRRIKQEDQEEEKTR